MFSGFIDIAALINNLFLNILLNVECFDHFIPQFLPDPPLFLYPHNFVFSLFSLNPSSVLPIYSWVCGHSPDMVDLTGNWLSLSLHLSIPNSSSAAWVVYLLTSVLHSVCFELAWVFHILSQLLWDYLCSYPAVSGWCSFIISIYCLWLCWSFPHPLLWRSQSLVERGASSIFHLRWSIPQS